MTAQQRGCRAAGRSTRRGRGHDASRVRRPNGRTAEGSRSRRAAQWDRSRAARRRLRGGAKQARAGAGWTGVAEALYRGDKSRKARISSA